MVPHAPLGWLILSCIAAVVVYHMVISAQDVLLLDKFYISILCRRYIFQFSDFASRFCTSTVTVLHLIGSLQYFVAFSNATSSRYISSVPFVIIVVSSEKFTAPLFAFLRFAFQSTVVELYLRHFTPTCLELIDSPFVLVFAASYFYCSQVLLF